MIDGGYLVHSPKACEVLRQRTHLRMMVRICDREGWIDTGNAIENLAAIVWREIDARRRFDRAQNDLRIATGQRENIERFMLSPGCFCASHPVTGDHFGVRSCSVIRMIEEPKAVLT